MDKEKALRIAEQLSEAHIASTCAVSPRDVAQYPGWKVEVWSTVLTYHDFKTLMRVCADENLELYYEDQPGEEGTFWLKSPPWKVNSLLSTSRRGRGA